MSHEGGKHIGKSPGNLTHFTDDDMRRIFKAVIHVSNHAHEFFQALGVKGFKINGRTPKRSVISEAVARTERWDKLVGKMSNLIEGD